MAPAHVPPLLLEWRALGCGYRARSGGWTAVLRGVYGYAAPGSLTAVMGPSGSGGWLGCCCCWAGARGLPAASR
jgi:hypothetical protein